MATALPEAKVAGFVGVAMADQDDADDSPEIAPCTSGFVDFIPLADEMQYIPGESGNNFLLGKGKFTCELDEQGRLTQGGRPYIKLLDLGHPSFNPRIPDPFATYRVEFRSLRLADGTQVTLSPRTIRPTAGQDNDLTVLSPVDPSAPVPMTQGRPGDPGIRWRGVWDAEEEYSVNDGVFRTAGSFRRIVAGVSATAPEDDAVNWFPIALGGGAGVSSWDDLEDKPSTFPPSAHQHPTADINGLAEFIRDTIATALTEGSNIDIVVDDNGDTITISSAGGLSSVAWADVTDKPTEFPPSTHNHTTGQITDLAEFIRDTIGSALVEGSGVDINVSDGGDTITIALADPTVNWADIPDKPSTFPPSTHSHSVAWGDVTGKPTTFTPSTHGHVSSDISDFAEAVRDTIGAALVEGANVNISVDDVANTITISIDPGSFVTTDGGPEQFVNWSPTPPGDLEVPRWDETIGAYGPSDLTQDFATVDSGGRLDSPNWPKYFVPMVILDEGQGVPADFPPGGLVYERPTPPSLVPLFRGSNSAPAASSSFTMVTSGALEVGDWVALGILTSAETTSGTLPTTMTASPGAGAWTVSDGPSTYQSGSVQVDMKYAKVTTAIPSGTTITITLNQSRVHKAVILAKLPNLVAANPLDRTAVTSGGSTADLTLEVGPTASATVQDNELGLVLFTNNDSTAPTTRPCVGRNGWNALSAIESDNGSTSRAITMLYKVLSVVEPVTGEVQVNASDGTTGAYAMVMGTFKAA